MVIYVTSSKLNLVIFLNCLVVLLTQAGNLMITIFFGQVRQVESKFLLDKAQKKSFQFLLLTVVLRNTIDIYKMMTLVTVLFIWMLHWLLHKRTKGLIGEENRNRQMHLPLLLLYKMLIGFDGLIFYIFCVQFFNHSSKINDIYIIIGFEFGRLTLKALEQCFKYHVSLCELSYRE